MYISTVRKLILYGFLFFMHQTLEALGNLDEYSRIEFCEGGQHQRIEKAKCAEEITFDSANLPACYCVKGIFAGVFDDCERIEGFARHVCLPTKSPIQNGDLEPLYSNLVSLKLLGEPDWEKSHLVIIDSTNPQKSGIHNQENLNYSLLETSLNSFYTINMKSWLVLSRRVREYQTLCLESHYDLLKGPQICNVMKSSNAEAWYKPIVQIVLKPARGCQSLGRLIPLQSEECTVPLQPENDQCVLHCSAENEIVHADNCTQEEKSIFHDNEYLERQLKKVAIGEALVTTTLANNNDFHPARSIHLFELMVAVTSGFCPESYVPKLWLNFMVSLFYSLHERAKFDYVEVIKDTDYNRIKTTLGTCLQNNHQINLTSIGMNGKPKCPNENIQKWASGYCQSRDATCRKPIPIYSSATDPTSKSNQKHAVPEVAWLVLDASLAICFREFKPDYRLLHILQQGIQQLFTQQIKRLWYYPPSILKPGGKYQLFGKSVSKNINNLEVCTAAAYNVINQEGAGRNRVFRTKLMRHPRPLLLQNFSERKVVQSQKKARNLPILNMDKRIEKSIVSCEQFQRYCNRTETFSTAPPA